MFAGFLAALLAGLFSSFFADIRFGRDDSDDHGHDDHDHGHGGWHHSL